MALSDILTGLQSTLTSIFSTASYGSMAARVVKVADNEYDMGVAIPGLGTQHLRITIDTAADKFTIVGSFDVIANNAQWPFSLAAQIVNSTVETWSKAALDAVVTPNAAPLALMSTPVEHPHLGHGPQVLVDTTSR